MVAQRAETMVAQRAETMVAVATKVESVKGAPLRVEAAIARVI